MDEVRRAYGEAAQQYIDLFAGVSKVHPDDLDLIGRHLSGPGLVLDVGCGPGHLTGHLRTLGTDAIGVDPVAELVAHARVAESGCRTGGSAALTLRGTARQSPHRRLPTLSRLAEGRGL